MMFHLLCVLILTFLNIQHTELKNPECKRLFYKKQELVIHFFFDRKQTSVRQPEFKCSVVGAGGDQSAVRRHVNTHHL